ncbi:MAG TPA: tripartite tricarboxylate transporter substrate binding protein, partial [Ramlibacter sp.]|nr:tripartite tricarboxylate transporter substrate binding protein [Ramlibacter sp.]
QPILLINRPGANGELGTQSVAEAAPDGYTLLFATTGPNVNALAMGRSVKYTAASFQPITMFVDSPSVLLVRSSLPVKNVQELIAYAKANPGKLNYGTLGPGSNPQLALMILNRSAGIDIKDIPYPGVAGAIVDVLAERLDLISSVMGAVSQHVQAGKLRPLGLVTGRRSPALPDLAPLSEVVPGYTGLNSWLGLMAPAGTPRDVVDRLYKASVEALRTPSVAEQMGKLAMTVTLPTPEQFDKDIKADIATWTELFRQAGVSEKR